MLVCKNNLPMLGAHATAHTLSPLSSGKPSSTSGSQRWWASSNSQICSCFSILESRWRHQKVHRLMKEIIMWRYINHKARTTSCKVLEQDFYGVYSKQSPHLQFLVASCNDPTQENSSCPLSGPHLHCNLLTLSSSLHVKGLTQGCNAS